MPNGKPGDQPVTDICLHGMKQFSRKVDKLIREVVRRGGGKRIERLVWDNDRMSGKKPDLKGMQAELERVLGELPDEEPDET